MSKYILSEIELEEVLSEIITGKKIFYCDGEIMCLKYPTSKDKDSSRTIYISKYREFEKIGLPKKEEMKILLLKVGALDKDFYVKKKKIEEDIDKLYKARKKTGSQIQLAQIDADIDLATKTLVKMEMQEDILMTNTIEYNAESYRINYIISRVTMCGIELEKRKWETYEDFLKEKNISLISECKKQYNKMMNGISQKKIRAVARTDEWKKRWEISKKTNTPVFDGVSSDWDKNKINLCYWSSFYDNIIENLNLKDESILDDDDELFELIRRRNNGQKDSTSNGTGNTIDISTPYKVRY